MTGILGCDPLSQTGSVRTELSSDGMWIVVVHHPGTKLWNKLRGQESDELGKGGLLSFGDCQNLKPSTYTETVLYCIVFSNDESQEL